jgi:hypothetical protein
MCFITSKYRTTASRAKENRIEDIHKRNRDVILKQEKKSWAINSEYDYDYFPRSSDPTVAPSDAPASAAAVNSS